MSLFEWTGNPFVDSGIGAMLAHARKSEPHQLSRADVQLVAEFLPRVYLTAPWLKAMQNIFPNTVWANPAFASCREEKAKPLVEYLAAKVGALPESGGCVCCGRNVPLRPSKEEQKNLPDLTISKTYVPLIGGVANFFPGGVKGADVCANCIWAIQCAPLNFYTLNFDDKRFVVMHSTSREVLREWAEVARRDVETQITTGTFTGPFNEGYRQINAFFHAVELVMAQRDFRLDETDRYTTIHFYHFDNYNQPKPQPLKIYDLPAPVFFFFTLANQQAHRAQWRKLLGQNYFWINKQRVPIPLPQTNSSEEEQERQKTQRNFVLEKLLRGDSILRHFFNRRRQVAHTSWEFLEIYLTEVLHMDENRIETIRRIADEMAEMIKAHENKKRLRSLETASSLTEFRNVLLRFARERVDDGSPSPLCTLDDVSKYLFPEAMFWRETQHLILFRLYERLHGWLQPGDVTAPDDDDDEGAEE